MSGQRTERPHNIPQAVSEVELVIGGLTLRVAVLDTGQRVFEAESIERFMAALSDPSFVLTQEDADRAARFVAGLERA